MTPFDTYKMYIALKQHFTLERYDYFRYNGMVRVSLDSFLSRQDKYYFDKLSRHAEPQGLMISNFSRSNNYWVGDLLKEESETTFKKWLAYNNSLSYNFKNEISRLPIIESCKVGKDDTPLLMKEFRRGHVSIETMIILDRFLGIFKSWDSKIQDTILWPDMKRKCLKYKPFMRYDKARVAKILKDQLHDQEAYI